MNRELQSKQLETTISDRKEYLRTIERDIEAVTLEANNKLLSLARDIETLETRKAELLRRNFEIDQQIREKTPRLAEQ